MMELADFLKEARTLIALPDNWIKHMAWATAEGFPVLVTGGSTLRHRVSRRCMVGALSEVTFAHPVEERLVDLRVPAIRLLEHAIKDKTGYQFSVPSFNDAPGVAHEDVLDVFDQAIAEAQE